MNWRATAWGAVFIPSVVGLLAVSSWAAAPDPVAVVVELRPGNGQIQVRRANEATWTPAQPLLSLREGDQIAVVGDGRVALTFAGGRGTRVVTAVDSPFSVEAVAGRTVANVAGGVAARVVDFLLGSRRESDSVHIGVRPAPPIRVAILSPRDSRLFPGPVVFEWTGFQSLRYRVRVTGPEGILWESRDLPLGQVPYPTSAPPLRAGIRYRWSLEAREVPAEEAFFELLSLDQADVIRRELESVAGSVTSETSRTGRIVVRAAYLVQQSLYVEARRELAAGIASDPAEPTLRYLSGVLYERLGLSRMAEQEFLEARDLIDRRP